MQNKLGCVLTLPSPAKLNLFLYITGQLPNGYHELQTLFQFIDLCDYLTFTPRQDDIIELTTPINGVKHEDNLIVKAARLLQKQVNSPHGVTIALEKHIPLGGGLGGASSNAATTLIALNYLWGMPLSPAKLETLAVSLGADVPIFVHGHAAFAEGIGEKLIDVHPEEKWYIVIHPNIHVSTAMIFNDPQLPRQTLKHDLSTLMRSSYKNDCEEIVKKHFSAVEQSLVWLLQYAPARLTGTGACVFGEFTDHSFASSVLKKVPAQYTAYLVRGLNLSPLHQLLGKYINYVKK